ncbi:cupin domain-containing protein [Paenibacillus apiarius]|uniref:cupin domain-containing protein n=1 Tax=Paenibacillus apiarius TaxID=46240 RepID=UPI001980D3DF|nr:cupin domain-containing protein [Paenibacillus apiarius]MBN3526708.1 cupin domain-containing protein [Paenibacillus apiarius]
MTTSHVNYATPDVEFAYDVNQSLYFKKDAQNYINVLGVNQLNSLGNTSLLDIFLSAGNMIEPHIHQNANELVYCITGEVAVSFINPFTNQLLKYLIKPGQVVNVPQGWWHYEIANKDHTHLIAIFDAPTPEVIFGSDILRLTPPEILAHSYCLNVDKVKETLAPIKKSVVIGPPANCHNSGEEGGAFMQQPHSMQPQPHFQQTNCPYHQQFYPPRTCY